MRIFLNLVNSALATNFVISKEKLTNYEAQWFCDEENREIPTASEIEQSLILSNSYWTKTNLSGESELNFAACISNKTETKQNKEAKDDMRFSHGQISQFQSLNPDLTDADFKESIKINKIPDHEKGTFIPLTARAARADYRWTNPINFQSDHLRIPLRFQSDSFHPIEKSFILASLTDVSGYLNNCLDFYDDTKSEMHFPYIFVRRYDEDGTIDNGCYSYVGRVSDDMQILNLGYGCLSKSTVQHEFLHALGFFHEQSRPDRDDHVEIVWENVQEDMKHNYKTLLARGFKWDDMGTPYDFNSIMHYQSTYFTKSEAKARGEFAMYKKPEMIPIFPKSPRMTTIDSKQLALMYSKFCALPEMDHCENDEEILKNRFCDGVTDCTDGSDEQNCGDYGCAKTIELASTISIKERNDFNPMIIKLLKGKYTKLNDLHNGRVIYKMHGHSHYIYYSGSIKKWMINQELHDSYSRIVSLSGDVSCPVNVQSWTWYDGNVRSWMPVPKISLECYGKCDGVVDECSSENDCHFNAYCTNNLNGYSCTCMEGFIGNGRETCDFPCQAAEGLDDHHYRIIKEAETFENSRKKCQEFGKSWDLAIINFRVEYSYLLDLLSHSCLTDIGFWMGYTENDEITETVFDKPAHWKIRWDKKNDRGIGQCAQIIEGRFVHVECESQSGAICENHNFNEYCQPKGRNPVYENDRYIFNYNASLIWDDARESCQSNGPKWDLAMINDQNELDNIVKFLNCPEVSFWIGQKDNEGHLTGVDGKMINFAPWDMHSNVLFPGANDATGNENCIKMRGKLIGDSPCYMSWTGAQYMNLPMGYICEKGAEACEVYSETAYPLENNSYKIIVPNQPDTVNFEQSREKCQEFGNDWDLVIFNDKNEFDYVQNAISDNCADEFVFWVGYTEENQVATSIFGDEIVPGQELKTWKSTKSLNWNTESNPLNPEPNDSAGIEECVRMTKGYFNDALCYLTHAGPRRNQIGMGYICERHATNSPSIIYEKYCEIIQGEKGESKCNRIKRISKRIMRNTKGKDRSHTCSKPHSFKQWEMIKREIKQVKQMKDFQKIFESVLDARLSNCPWHKIIKKKSLILF